MFDRLFRKKPKESMRDVVALIAPFATPAVRIALAKQPARSHVGGLPDLPANTPWPEFNGSRLDFLARLSLEELQRMGAVPWLPARGALLFFYDVKGQPWGYDPKDRGRWAFFSSTISRRLLKPQIGMRVAPRPSLLDTWR